MTRQSIDVKLFCILMLNRTFTNMDELIDDYKTGALHPADVKPALAKAINQILQPIRDHFNNNSEAKILLNTVKKYRVTN
jgi:tyrosyl-tRNA synthetase